MPSEVARLGVEVHHDMERGLAGNTVPAAAVIYFNDMYVPSELSLRTAAAIAGLAPWVTSEFDHDGLRASDRVLDRLIALARDEA